MGRGRGNLLIFLFTPCPGDHRPGKGWSAGRWLHIFDTSSSDAIGLLYTIFLHARPYPSLASDFPSGRSAFPFLIPLVITLSSGAVS